MMPCLIGTCFSMHMNADNDKFLVAVHRAGN